MLAGRSAFTGNSGAIMSVNRLLILDDEPATGAFISRIASGMGYEILAVSTAAEFLEQVHAWAPTHIMLDLGMPGVDELSLLSHLAAEKCPSNIILMNNADHTTVEAARRVALDRGLKLAGALTKPMRVADLSAALDAVRHEGVWLSVAGLSTAMERAEFHLHYQPKLDLTSGKIMSFEALMRWQHPTRGVVPPASFIPFAESSTFIDRLTNWLTEEASRQLRAWDGSGHVMDVAINLSSRNLHDARLADVLEEHCRSNGIAPERITLELTETAAMHDAVQMIDVLARLRLKGFKLSIDDFGTGYSSLAQLHRLPFSEIKIDRSFVADCVTSGESRSIVKLVIDLAHALGMKAVGEGVETTEVIDVLRELGCDQAQGYHVARPMAGEAVLPFLQKHNNVEWIGKAAE
jgi:EAL domain-containing protein (putative c-di-GMP-specific phosphodiesterase class I)